MSWMIISTWQFSDLSCRIASEQLSEGACAIESMKTIASAVEKDVMVDSVGYGGFPNAEGEVELDAACMNGTSMQIGAIAGVKNYLHVFDIAVTVMEKSPHNMLVGIGAEDFAQKMGYLKSNLLTEEMKKKWLGKIQEGNIDPFGHDTVGIVALDNNGDMAAGTSTSGLSMKARGRVGDSPLVGSGFYVDSSIGGAAATGVGEDIMKGCLCFQAVELMRTGMTPKDAAETVIERHHNRLKQCSNKVGNMAIVCGDKQGRFGGAANHTGFSYAAGNNEIDSSVYHVEPCCEN